MRNDGALMLVRVAVATTMLTSGVVKLLFANQGVLRFAKVGLPDPALLAPFVSWVEIAGGALLLVGLATRWAAIPLVVDMCVAIVTTKAPFLLGPGVEPLAGDPKIGLWAFLYQARLDVAMLTCCAALAVVGAGA